jgi:PleD family two-component response regulator
MDHSYRTANGNIAENSPSTIELRNGNVNGYGNGGYGGESLAMWEPPAAPIREDAPTHIYFFIEDLFFLAKIQETAKKLGVKVGFLKNEKDTVSKFVDAPEEERPSLIVFDLNNVNAKPLTLIPKLRSKLKKGTSIIGFLSHLQGDLKVKAVEAGCDMVMPRSAFSQNLPNLMRRHGLKDEDEEFEAAPAY